MRKVKFTLSIGLVGCKREDTIKFDDDVTDQEIQETYEEWQLEQLDGGWEDTE